ncbi:MAG: DUF3786 domain-containing protein [Oscillospiraceae bacterium]|nr:DUF3786 domain-containing protein [Oscillospiraceae bacterium]
MTNHEKVYEELRLRLADCDLAEAAPRAGLVFSDGAVGVRTLGRELRVTNSGVELVSGPPCSVNLKSVLVWYLTFGGAGDASYEFVPVHSFSHGIFGSQSPDFSSHGWRGYAGLTPERFAAVSGRIGAELVRRERYGESRLLVPLPKLPVLLTFSEADDEFAAQIDLKVGKNATDFLPFETLCVMCGLVTREYGAAGNG